VSSSTGA